MIKSVLFDWFNTLARYDPPREELYLKAFRDHGINLSLQTIYKGLLVGDRYFFSLSNRGLIRGKNTEERAKHFIYYPQSIANEAKISISEELQVAIINKVMVEFSNAMDLFEDVKPVFQILKSNNLSLGIITNAEKSVNRIIEYLGIDSYLDFVLTSEEAGAEKPAAAIFLKSLEKSGLDVSEVIYVGDQYQSDILGARGVGMKGILLDRYDICQDVKDCPRINSLNELIPYVNH